MTGRMLALRHQGAGCDSDRPALGRPKDLWLRRRRHARGSRAGLTRRLLIAASDRASHARARSKNYAYQNWKPTCQERSARTVVWRGFGNLKFRNTRVRARESSKVSWEPTGTLTPIDVDARPNRNSRDCSYAVTH